MGESWYLTVGRNAARTDIRNLLEEGRRGDRTGRVIKAVTVVGNRY
jgi:hypothetical protein